MDQAYFQHMEDRIPKGGVRTRFAPSPTGYMHVGNLRTALYTWLIARKMKGTFIFRLEDTDQARQVDDAAEIIYRTLKECGLDHDEGPDIGGPVGPYIQTQRRDIYKKYAELLIETGHAYYCFCEKAESEEDAGDFDRPADPCRTMDPAEALRRVQAGEPYVVRQKIPTEGVTTFHDVSFGDITVENKTLNDQILLKRDGLPTYNFANVVDDHLMGITHVVRGSEYLSSAPKYDLLYRAFGWDIPEYVHCSPVMRDHQHKLSKRHGDASYEDLRAQGYLTGAILNYVALLGWAPRGEFCEKEIFTLPELVEAFDITGISKSPAIFDTAKLDYFNGIYLRALPAGEFAALAEPYIRSTVGDMEVCVPQLAAVLQPRLDKLSQIPELIGFIARLPEFTPELFFNKKSGCNAQVAKGLLQRVTEKFSALTEWTAEPMLAALAQVTEEAGVKKNAVMWAVRIAVSGQTVTPGGAVELCIAMGRREAMARLTSAAEKL